jgi:hypothetical protein
MTGEVAAVVVVVSVAAVLEDLVLLLQPLRANPASIKVNNIVFFIGGLSCSPSDPRSSDRFAIHHARGRVPLGYFLREFRRATKSIRAPDPDRASRQRPIEVPRATGGGVPLFWITTRSSCRHIFP